MRNALAMGAVLLLTACGSGGNEQSGPAQGGEGGPPPPPPYEMRAEAPSGSRLAPGRDGAALFSNRCGFCHLSGGMGTNILIGQRVALGEPPENGLLTNRDDLTADYVIAVVRQGKVAMPPQTRVDVTDEELFSIARYLEKGS